MPPKKDDKKKKGAAVYVPKEVDASHYVRKAVPLPQVAPEKLVGTERPSGKIINIETLFPEWSNDEVWSEPLAPEQVPKPTYPNVLGVQNSTTIAQFFNLLPEEAPDAKKKKDTKKPPAKGAPVSDSEMVELLVNEDGKPLPVVFRDDESGTSFSTFPPLRGFLKRRRATATEEETGEDAEDFVDPLLCESFRMISEFASRVVRDHPRDGPRTQVVQEMDDNYLWRAIYPKLPSGKPCYNPSGKYCVKLYLAGKWRKVYVDDSIPLNSAGEVAVAFSSDPLELWPLLLSKAVYTVYTACGYTFAESTKTSQTQASALHPVGHGSPGLHSCQVLEFALHLVTSWHPHHSADIGDLFLDEKSKGIKLIKSMIESGTPSIDRRQIVSPSDNERFFLNNDPTASGEQLNLLLEQTVAIEAVGSPQKAPVGEQDVESLLMTKKKFKEDYLRRRKDRQEIVDAILSRERKIDAVEAQVLSSKKEVFCAVVFSPKNHRYVVLPILGLSFVDPNIDSIDADDILETLVLLDWHRYPVVDVTPATNDPVILGKGRVSVPEFLQPFPQASPLRATWKSLRQLADEGSFLAGLFTFTHAQFQTEWSRHWLPATPPAEAAAKDAKDKGAKKATGKASKDAAPTPVEEEVCISQGLPPATFLSLRTGALFDNRQSLANLEIEQALADQQQAMIRTPPLTDVASSEGLLEQQGSLAETSSENPVVFMDVDPGRLAESAVEGLSIVVTIHADIVKEPEGAVETPLETQDPPSPDIRGLGKRQTSWDASSVPQQKVLPSNTVLVLQEVRFDAEPPLIFVTQLRETSLLPMSSKTFSIPKHRLPKDPKQPMLFWMRLFTKASVYISVRTAVEASIGLAEEIWTQQCSLPSMVQEGDAGATVEGVDQLLFRLPLHLAPHALGPSAEAGEVTASVDSRALVFFHMADPSLEPHSHLLTVHHRHGQSIDAEELPDLQGVCIDLSQKDHGEMLLGYCRALTAQAHLPAFHWKLVILSHLVLLPPERPVNEVPVSQRFTGRYIANSKHRLFRDVLTVETASFPLAFKFYTQPIIEIPGVEHIPLLLRMFRKGHEAKPVAEYHGEDLINGYLQTISGFLPPEGEAPVPTPTPVATAATKAGAEKAKDKKGTAPPPVDSIEIIVECILDVEHLEKIPDLITSRFPHVFDDLFEKGIPEEDSRPGAVSHRLTLEQQCEFLAIKPPRQPLFGWTLDILAGRVAQCQHDVSSLARFAAVKNGWEEKNAGETERAAAAIAYMHERLQVAEITQFVAPHETIPDLQALAAVDPSTPSVPQLPPALTMTKPVIELTPVMAENVAAALGGDTETFQERFARLHLLPRKAEQIEVIEPEHNDEALKQSLINPYNLVGEIGSEPWVEAVQTRRVDNKQFNEAYYERIRARAIEFGATYREDVKHRVHILREEHKQQRLQLAEAWTLRERYRFEAEAKNASLQFLLRRAKDAKQQAREMEAAAELERQKNEAKKAKKK